MVGQLELRSMVHIVDHLKLAVERSLL